MVDSSRTEGRNSMPSTPELEDEPAPAGIYESCDNTQTTCVQWGIG